jgi:two-component system nitrate/nitrite response regulator NarL
MQGRLQTIIVEQNALLRESLARILDNSHFHTVATASRVDDLVLSSLTPGDPILILLGIPDDITTALRAIEYLKEQHSTAHIVALARVSNAADAVLTFRAGANAYLAEVGNCDALMKALELVVLGDTVFPFSVLCTILEQEEVQFDSNAFPPLSAKEKSILDCLADGSPNKVIARKIDVAEATVKVHVKSILRKIRVQNRTQAALWAIKHRRYRLGLEKPSNADGRRDRPWDAHRGDGAEQHARSEPCLEHVGPANSRSRSKRT